MCSLPPSTSQNCCKKLRSVSLYQSLLPPLRIVSFSVFSKPRTSRFMRNFKLLKFKFATEEMHICQI